MNCDSNSNSNQSRGCDSAATDTASATATAEKPLTAISPALNTFEDEAGVHLNVALPGVRKEDLKLTFQEGVLHIEAPRGDSGIVYKVSTRLAQRLAGEKISAKLENGVLEALIPLREEAQLRSIPVE